ncbi:hydrolase [Reticulomyxa filosa]|uniref:Hydrolase n=1 Tax=Reticulomyxa filosa TaxID=46433 RepID=X6MBX8_RETFI|nr:hydrolase [Reticulomyxa filosa]|eukprot:ETO10555.1 hydrolase [Reticulomyxa filosa]
MFFHFYFVGVLLCVVFFYLFYFLITIAVFAVFFEYLQNCKFSNNCTKLVKIKAVCFCIFSFSKSLFWLFKKASNILNLIDNLMELLKSPPTTSKPVIKCLNKSFLTCYKTFGLKRISYVEWVREDKPVPTSAKHPPHLILCHHALSWNAMSFEHLAHKLLTKHIDRLPRFEFYFFAQFVSYLKKKTNTRILAMDAIGRGDSDWLPETNGEMYGYHLYIPDSVTWISRIVGPEVESIDPEKVKITWIGTSMGGIVGMLLACDPKNTPLSKLILNDIGPFVSKQVTQNIGNYLSKVPTMNSIDDVIKVNKKRYELKIRYSEKWPQTHFSEEDWHWLARVMSQEEKREGKSEENDKKTESEKDKNSKYIFRYDPNIVRNFDKVDNDWDFFNLFDLIKIPTLLIRGAKSEIVSKELMEKMKVRGPKPKCVELQNFGHAPMLLTDDEIDPIIAFIEA